MLSALKALFSAPPFDAEAHRAYSAIINWSREPVLYADYGIKDTVDGRFDAIVLHLFLYAQRIRQEEGLEEFERRLNEIFFADMDRSLREMGASDTGVGKRIKKMAQAFFGRMQAYSDSWPDRDKMKEALKRNLYRDDIVSDQAVEKMIGYLQALEVRLKGFSQAQLLQPA